MINFVTNIVILYVVQAYFSLPELRTKDYDDIVTALISST